MEKNIWFDMDGTIASLYTVNGWLEKLLKEDATPYRDAKPMINMGALARQLNKLTQQGYTINIVSWLSKDSTQEFDKKVTQEKKKWLKKHLKSVRFTKIDIIKYGTPKQHGRKGILFDDEKRNRESWKGKAYDVNNILGVLKGLK